MPTACCKKDSKEDVRAAYKYPFGLMQYLEISKFLQSLSALTRPRSILYLPSRLGEAIFLSRISNMLLCLMLCLFPALPLPFTDTEDTLTMSDPPSHVP